MNLRAFSLLLFLLLATATAQPDQLPGTSREIRAPDHVDVAYGPDDRNFFDLWESPTPGARPLAIFIHGGGWVSGDKSKLNAVVRQRLLASGISVASINYRYSTTAPFPAPMHDAARALQFIRHYSERFRIAPDRVACFGGSAGAVTSLWLAFHDDLADSDSDDPVLRQSTRITCAASIAAPTTLDMRVAEQWFGVELVTHPALLRLFGVDHVAELDAPDARLLVAEASPITHLTRDDPPVFMAYATAYARLPSQHDANTMIHHPEFGVRLKEAMDLKGVESHLMYPRHQPETYRDLVAFLVAKLNSSLKVDRARVIKEPET